VPFFTAINTSMEYGDHITGFTLVDITRTGVTHNRHENEHQRNQQRNWETVIQCLGLRVQPMDIQGPKMMEMFIDEHTFGEMYHGKQRVWCFTFSVERDGVWEQDGDPLALLHKDFNEVPVIQGLEETARFMLPIFYTAGAIKNVFFKLGRLDLNSI
jgi:hypothetical protein